MQARVLVLRAAGTNCDMETQYAFQKVGASADLVHINQLLSDPSSLHQYHILVIPGGFTYGDDIAAGKILANQIRHHLQDEIDRFIAEEKLILGICNGFQILVKAGLLPGGHTDDHIQDATLTSNDSNKFEDRWVYLKVCSKKTVFLNDETQIYLPVAHGEGKFVVRDDSVHSRMIENDQVVFRYVNAGGDADGYPWNPNGSLDNIAGICDPTGRILGMMPHPERHVEPYHHPRWTREGQKDEGEGLTIFRNAVQYVESRLLSKKTLSSA